MVTWDSFISNVDVVMTELKQNTVLIIINQGGGVTQNIHVSGLQRFHFVLRPSEA